MQVPRGRVRVQRGPVQVQRGPVQAQGPLGQVQAQGPAGVHSIQERVWLAHLSNEVRKQVPASKSWKRMQSGTGT